MFARKHIPETGLALYAAGDLPVAKWFVARVHVAGCARCRDRVTAYRSDRELTRALAGELPPGLAWDRLAGEMAANIRVGLAAGECVARPEEKRTFPAGWRVAAAAAGFSALLISAWWLNMPRSQTASLERAVKKIALPWRGGAALEDGGPLVEVSAAGVQLRANGGVLGVSQGVSRPISVTLSVQGSARARYLDLDTGQVTITSVYAQ